MTAEWDKNPAYAPFAAIVIAPELVGLPERPTSATPVTFMKAYQISSDRKIGLMLGFIQALVFDPRDCPIILIFEPFFRFMLISVTGMRGSLLHSASTVKGSVMLLPVILAES